MVKIIFYFSYNFNCYFLKNIFDISISNNLKTLKKYYFKQKINF